MIIIIPHFKTENALAEAFEILLTSNQTAVLHITVKEDIENLENIPWHPIEIKEEFLNKI